MSGASSSTFPPTTTSTQSSTPTDDGLMASCTTAVPGKYGNVPVDACNSYYNFDPQFEPAVAVAVLFGLLSIAHIVEAIVFRKRYAWVVIMGALWETAAFVLHALGAHDQQSIGYATAYNILFLLAPLWINAFVYMTFARMVYYFTPAHKVAFIRATGISKYFVLADVFTFIVQASGGVMTDPGEGANLVAIGLKIYLAGLGCQEFFILCFLALMVVFHRESLMSSGPSVGDERLESQRSWKPLLYTLYAVLGFISLRIFYRIAEFAGGITTSNPVPFHEAYGYSLDAFPMMVCLLLLAVMHPGRTLRGPGSEFPRKSRAEKKAEKLAKKQEKAARKAARKGKDVVEVELVQTLPGSLESDGSNGVHRNPLYDS